MSTGMTTLERLLNIKDINRIKKKTLGTKLKYSLNIRNINEILLYLFNQQVFNSL